MSHNRFIRWSRLGVFLPLFAELAAKGGKPDTLMIDATHLKAHRTAASLLKEGLSGTIIHRIIFWPASLPDVSAGPRAA
jgi:transposase